MNIERDYSDAVADIADAMQKIVGFVREMVFKQFIEGMNESERTGWHRATHDPRYLFVANTPISTHDPLGLVEWLLHLSVLILPHIVIDLHRKPNTGNENQESQCHG